MPKTPRPQSYYDDIKQKFAEAREVRLGYRPEGTDQFTSELTGDLAQYAVDPNAREVAPRLCHIGGACFGLELTQKHQEVLF